MRSLGEADWFGYRVDVPLTGREPVMGRLRNRLRTRGPGWGWVTIHGPHGGGVTRVLQEAAALAQGEVGPAPIWIRPAHDTDQPLEPLRRALAPIFAHLTVAEAARSLRAMVSAPESDVDTLAAWMLAGSLDQNVFCPSVEVARRVLDRVVPGGLVIVDDYDLLDDRTKQVLLPSVAHQGVGVIAGLSGDATLAPEATLWSLDPLSGAQVELLLKRWLRNTATARRLAPELAKHYAGWPGRIVESVRSLGRDQLLSKAPRGIVVKQMPTNWPDGRRPANAFLDWARALGAPATRLLELTALQGEPAGTPLLADAAGVKQSFVEAVRAEAAAVRDGALPGRFYGSAREAEDARRRLDPERRVELGTRLATAWARRPATADATACVALGRVVGYIVGGQREIALTHLPQATSLLRALKSATNCDLRRLVRLGELLGPPQSLQDHPPLVALAELLVDYGHPRVARRVLPAHGAGASLREVWVLARLDLSSGLVNEAHARLTTGLAAHSRFPDLDGVQADPEVLFDAWALLSRLCQQLADPDGARDAWRAAGRVVQPGDLARRAAFHQGAAACAAVRGAKRAVAAHLRRAVPMLESLGHVKEAACVRARLGDVEADLGRHQQAVECLSRAAHQHAVVGAADAEMRTRLKLGITYLECSAHDQAVDQLDMALVVAERENLHMALTEIHLSLATAHRGRGDLARERAHAEQAAGSMAPANIALRANAVLAEADLRAGAPGAHKLLERCERDLRVAGFIAEADEARALLFDARLRAGDMGAAAELLGARPTGPRLKLGRARLDLAQGRDPDASIALEGLASDPSLALDLRTVAYAHLAEALRRQGRLLEARAAGISASALLEVQHRSRRDDLRIHRILARVFREVGDQGRAASHQASARRLLRALLVGVDPRESLRLARAQWRTDPRRTTVQSA